MLSKVLILSVFFAVASAVLHRNARAVSGAATGGAVSTSFSSAGAGTGVGLGSGVNMFRFPTPIPPFGGFPAFGMNQAFQRFLESANAAHITAGQDPVFNKVYQQQMAILASLQQMALARYPFAFPGFDLSNSVGTETGTWTSTGGGLGTRTGSDPAVFTSGVVSFGTPGGAGVITSFPGGSDGLGVRVAEEFPAPSGPGTFGTFSSSSSGVSNINGETTSYKTSTIGVNDNGRITFRTV